MKKYIFLLMETVIISVAIISPAFAEIRRSDLAGTWYSPSKVELSAELKSYLDKAEPEAIEEKIIGLISPHAGFSYSGPVAAYGYKAIQGQDIKTVIIVGFSHRKYYDGIALLDGEGFSTSLGVVGIDNEITKELTEKNQKIISMPEAFSGENSIEMQIPFLQMVLKDFRLVLVEIGEQSLENCDIIANALYEVLKDRDKYLMIASSDMSHYLSYDDATNIDNSTIAIINKFDPLALYERNESEGHNILCGYGAVCAVMRASKMLGASNIKKLRYANSGDITQDKNRVVGYLSAAITKPMDNVPQPKGIKSDSESEENIMLNKEQRKILLKLARDTITLYLRENKILEVKEDDPVLNKKMGAFVTLHERGELRGCIGNLVGTKPLYLTVRDMAIEAATGDPRFLPVTFDEMKNIDIEISALSPLERIDDPEKIEIGKHGVIVKKGFLSGVYLPQVAIETGWNRDQFMDSLCAHKAGMNKDAWRKGECEIYIFTAEVFREGE